MELEQDLKNIFARETKDDFRGRRNASQFTARNATIANVTDRHTQVQRENEISNIISDLVFSVSRRRRSTWKYWLSGGPLTSNYVDKEIKKTVHLIDSKDEILKRNFNNQLRNVNYALNKTHSSLGLLQTKMCSNKVITDVNIIKSMGHSENLDFMSNIIRMVRTCQLGQTMPEVNNEELSLICKTHLPYWFCNSAQIREIFICRIGQIKYANHSGKINFVLKIPRTITEVLQII